MNGLTVLELFCGGGIGTAGFKEAGYDIVKAIDFDKHAVAAYRHNFGDHVEQADISSVDINELPNTDVVFGGPPCQSWSNAGNGLGAADERGKLVWRYLEIIEAKQPKAFVFENVKGLIGKKHRPTFESLIAKFNEIGYDVNWQLINAWDYGVAQKRERVFIIGIRKDLGFTFEFPTPKESEYRTQVLRDVIGDLNESYPNHTPEDKLPMYIQNVVDGKTTTNFGAGIPVNNGDAPAKTVIASYRSKCPNELTAQPPRRFTVRECLRIQSVPDTYVLPDDLSLSAQYRIVGNGIASKVAYVIGKSLAEQLNEKGGV